jgi:hypothetical protein
MTVPGVKHSCPALATVLVETCLCCRTGIFAPAPAVSVCAESEYLAGECFRHPDRHYADHPYGDISVVGIELAASHGYRRAKPAVPGRSAGHPWPTGDDLSQRPGLRHKHG